MLRPFALVLIGLLVIGILIIIHKIVAPDWLGIVLIVLSIVGLVTPGSSARRPWWY